MADPDASAAPPAPPRTSTPIGIATVSLAVLSWGVGNTVIAATDLPGLGLAFYRLLLAALLYLPILHLRGGRLTRESFRFGWLGGLAFAADVATFFIAIQLTSVANATTIAALQPLVIMGFAAAMFGERIHTRHVASAIVATGGVAMVAFGAARSGTGRLVGDVVAVAALLAWAWYFVESKRARARLGTLEYMTAMNIVAFLAVAPIALAAGQVDPFGGDLEAGRALGVLAIVLVPGTGHVVFNWAHAHTTLVTTSLLTLAMPVISTIAAALFLDQRVVLVQALGIVVVLVALAVVIVGDARSA